MNCTNDNFTIIKGSDNTFVFTIKQNNSTLPITIDPSDTFNAKLVNLADDTVAVEKLLTTVNAASGQVGLDITIAETALLISDKSTKVDRYYNKPTYKLILECVTAANGSFLAKVDEVYVD